LTANAVVRGLVSRCQTGAWKIYITVSQTWCNNSQKVCKTAVATGYWKTESYIML